MITVMLALAAAGAPALPAGCVLQQVHTPANKPHASAPVLRCATPRQVAAPDVAPAPRERPRAARD